jgi:hypothetical protein
MDDYNSYYRSLRKVDDWTYVFKLEDILMKLEIVDSLWTESL